jgi:hypothetical protein
MQFDRFVLPHVSRRRLLATATGSALAATGTVGHPGGATAHQAASPDSTATQNASARTCGPSTSTSSIGPATTRSS